MKDILVSERYRLDYKIGQGGLGIVYAGTDMQSFEKVAIKLMDINDERKTLQIETIITLELSGGIGMPRVRWSGQEGEFNVMILNLLGPSLEDAFAYHDRQFSLKTILLIADQAISRIEYVHSKGYLHRDIKPGNFVMGAGEQENILYIIDFGAAIPYDGERNKAGDAMTGTAEFASINSHMEQEVSWSDDLESLGYMLLYLAQGELPWEELTADSDKEKCELIKEKKMAMSVETLCSGLPAEFVTYMNYTRSLGPAIRPDYNFMRNLFSQLFTSQGFENGSIFDWTHQECDICKLEQQGTSIYSDVQKPVCEEHHQGGGTSDP